MSNLEVEPFQPCRGGPEVCFTLGDGDEEEYAYAVRVHPWDRLCDSDDDTQERDRSVFISVELKNATGVDNLDDFPAASVIVNRDEFVGGLLAVFPELKLKKKRRGN